MAGGIVAHCALPLLPMGFVGLALLRSLPSELARALIGACVLLVTWAPGWLRLGGGARRSHPGPRFFALGVFGATGFAVRQYTGALALVALRLVLGGGLG